MARKPPKESENVLALSIDWQNEGVPSVFANQMMVQADEHEIYLSFFEIVPPMLPPDDAADRRKVMEKLGGKIAAKCVARIVINAERMDSFVEAMASTLAKRRMGNQALANGKRDQ